jgi:hypothetical protein
MASGARRRGEPRSWASRRSAIDCAESLASSAKHGAQACALLSRRSGSQAWPGGAPVEMFIGQLEAIARYVDSVGTDGLYEIVEEYTT